MNKVFCIYIGRENYFKFYNQTNHVPFGDFEGIDIVPKMSTIVPIMGTKHPTSSSEALFGKTRLAVLTLLFDQPDQEFFVRQVAQTVRTGLGAVHRELILLADAGILLRKKKGRQVYFQANRECPFFGELKSLLVKTVGLADVLRRALAPLADNIKIAFVFGSFARKSAQARSDVDLAVVGEVSFGVVVSALSEAQETLAREINPVVYSVEEFRIKAGSQHFTGSLLDTEKIFLIGSQDDIERLAE